MNAVRLTWIVLAGLLVVLAIAAMICLSRMSATDEGAPRGAAAPAATASVALRLGLIPERNIFEQRRRYRALADYISARLDQPVHLVTNNTYEGVLDDFGRDNIDVAFLGSLVATLAMDRYGVIPLVKPQTDGGITTYRGVILARADSPILKVEDLAGRSIAMVKATTAADLYPFSEMIRLGLPDGPQPPQIRWVGTHDAVIQAVVEGTVDAGAAKDLRLDAYEAAGGGPGIRRLAVGAAVPNNALVVRPGLDATLVRKLERVLLAMDGDPEALTVLETFGAVRFVPCAAAEYAAVHDMVDALQGRWDLLEVSGPPPVRPPAAAEGE